MHNTCGGLSGSVKQVAQTAVLTKMLRGGGQCVAAVDKNVKSARSNVTFFF